MKTNALMSIKQLAELLRVSTDTIRRAARSGLIPSTREGTAYRFDWDKVRQAMRARAQQMPNRRSKEASAPAGNGRRRAAQSPPIGNTGAWLTP
jgi:excisionase family DNA binding protein